MAILFLSLLSIFLLSGCEIQEDVAKAQNHERKVSDKPFKDLLLLKDFNNAYNKVVQTKDSKNLASKSTLEDEFNFTISDEKAVKIIEVDNKTYYNMLIKRDSIHAAYFENLVIMMEKINDADVMSAFLLKYIPTEQYKLEAINNPEIAFDGTIVHTTIYTERWVTVCKLFSAIRCTGQLGSSGACGATPHIPYPDCITFTPNCIGFVTLESCDMINMAGGDHGYGHDVGQTPIGNPESGGGSPTGNGGATTIPDPSNESGATTVEIAPVNDLPTQEDIKKPCDELKKITDKNVIKNNIIMAQNHSTDEDEFGFSFIENGLNMSSAQIINVGGSGTLNIPYGGSIFAAIHTHQYYAAYGMY